MREDPEQDAFLRSPEARLGHPTVPGPRDAYRPRRGLASPGNGAPGLPRLQPTPTSHGPGLPGHTPSGPIQPGVHWDGPSEDDF